ncbi:MAG: hypothetical protein K0R66_18 [Gammaproteobacteria bacterium]|jgi:hypothetical protein|nr:hypothetical protein [Gammaproteobacteria bacterium]
MMSIPKLITLIATAWHASANALKYGPGVTYKNCVAFGQKAQILTEMPEPDRKRVLSRNSGMWCHAFVNDDSIHVTNYPDGSYVAETVNPLDPEANAFLAVREAGKHMVRIGPQFKDFDPSCSYPIACTFKNVTYTDIQDQNIAEL